MPYMMTPGDHEVVAEAIHRVLSRPPSFTAPLVPQGTSAGVAGIWDVELRYLCGRGAQRFLLEQSGNEITGAHQGEIYQGNLGGTVHANQVKLRSAMPVGGNTIHYHFEGTVQGDSMQGTVGLGEYGQAEWTAVRQKA